MSTTILINKLYLLLIVELTILEFPEKNNLIILYCCISFESFEELLGAICLKISVSFGTI